MRTKASVASDNLRGTGPHLSGGVICPGVLLCRGWSAHLLPNRYRPMSYARFQRRANRVERVGAKSSDPVVRLGHPARTSSIRGRSVQAINTWVAPQDSSWRPMERTLPDLWRCLPADAEIGADFGGLCPYSERRVG